MLDEARHGESDPLGKCDARVDVPMPERMHNDVICAAGARGMSASQYIRLVLARDLYGELERIRRMVRVGDGPGDGRNVG